MNKIMRYREYRQIKNQIKRNGKEKFIFLGTPEYGNIGDQAICIAIFTILQKINPNKNIIEIPASMYWLYKKELSNVILPSDVIFTIGGGNLGDLYENEEKLRQDIILRFRANKIVVMPQSICFTETKNTNSIFSISKKIYSEHPKLFLITRDEASYLFAKNNFKGVKVYLLPDCVTVLEDELDLPQFERNGITFLLRKDKEKITNDVFIDEVKSILDRKKIKYQVKDTHVPYVVNKKNRLDELMDKLKVVSKSKLVITDRFHGLIFSVITHTPVIVFKSFDSKISEGIKWFINSKNVYYAEENIQEIKKIINQYFIQEYIVIKDEYTCKSNLLEGIKDIIDQ